MSFFIFTRWTVGSGIVPIFVHSKRPLTGDAAIRHLRKFPGAIAVLPPSILEGIARRDDVDFSVLRSCRRVFFGGAPINPYLAKNLVTQHVPLVALFGS